MTVLSVEMEGSTRLDAIATLEAELARLEVKRPDYGYVGVSHRLRGHWQSPELVYTARWSR